MSIAILCPTRKRPEQLKRMVKSAFATASSPDNIRIYVAFDKDEFESYLPVTNDCQVIFMPHGMPTAHKWNLLAELAMKMDSNTHFMVAGDDMVFATPCWDKAVLDAYERKPHVYHLLDSRHADGTPHPIVTREYIEAMGYFVPPLFMHWFIDTWTVEIATRNNIFTHFKEYMLIHDKPNDIGKPDETHTGIRAMGWMDRDTWVAEHMKPWLYHECSRLDGILG